MRFGLFFALALASVLLLSVRPTAAQSGLPDEALGKEWELVSLQGEGTSAIDTSAKGLTLQFATDGSIAGSDGCNSFTGTYKADEDGNLEITLGGTTKRACEQAVMTLARTYTQALDEILGYRVVGAGLVLDGTDGSVLTFAKAPVGPPKVVPETAGEEAPLTALALVALLMVGGGALVLRQQAV